LLIFVNTLSAHTLEFILEVNFNFSLDNNPTKLVVGFLYPTKDKNTC